MAVHRMRLVEQRPKTLIHLDSVLLGHKHKENMKPRKDENDEDRNENGECKEEDGEDKEGNEDKDEDDEDKEESDEDKDEDDEDEEMMKTRMDVRTRMRMVRMWRRSRSPQFLCKPPRSLSSFRGILLCMFVYPNVFKVYG